MRENKNLREEIEKYNDQCKEVKSKYYVLVKHKTTKHNDS